MNPARHSPQLLNLNTQIVDEFRWLWLQEPFLLAFYECALRLQALKLAKFF